VVYDNEFWLFLDILALTSITLPGRQSRAREVYTALREAILDGTLMSGDRLIEDQIAAMASVSRTPVREAIRRLEAEGFLEDSESGAVAVAVTLTQKALAEICEVREALEGLASRRAALARSEMVPLTLRDLVERWGVALQNNADEQEFVRLNHVFHETLWDASGNAYLVEQLRILRTRIELSGRSTLGTPERAAEAMAEHAELLEAITRRDADAAEELARSHFRRALAVRLANVRLESVNGA
jgi:DNA-binding GntR family transcriptional regulator